MFANGFLFPAIFPRRQQRPRKTISKRPWHVIVNAMAYIRRESNTESTLAVNPVWKVCIAQRISQARNFDAFYIITIKFLKSPACNFQTFQSGSQWVDVDWY
jgi:hypothetical protein